MTDRIEWTCPACGAYNEDVQVPGSRPLCYCGIDWSWEDLEAEEVLAGQINGPSKETTE